MAKNFTCDVCEMQRARKYCEADEAYLCLECDASVHGANTLASRHKRHELGEDQDEGDGVCPGSHFQVFPESTPARATSLDFPLGGIKIGDITYARVSQDVGSSAIQQGAGTKEDEEAHEVPRFVPVAQELPSLEPFRFHALATAGVPPVRSTRFMSLLETGETDTVEHEEDAAAQENQELGVVPDLTAPPVGEPAPPKGPKADKEREARVNRYREKRRTRMFSKKIRYEVRKIYAENRPRLKGRFVRRTNEVDSLQCIWSEDQVRN